MDTIRAALLEICEELHPVTVRQVFYQAVSRGVIDKTEAEYKRTVGRLLTAMRRDGTIPYGFIVDSTRWMRKPKTHDSLESYLDEAQRFYRRDIWQNQGCYVEVWLEKEALAGVLLDSTAKWHVPLMVTRGYPSLSYVHEAALTIQDQNRPTFLYYFGDHDPSGADISRFVESGIRELAPDADIIFKRVAVNEDQIELMNLPTRPTKTSDSRSKGFEGESVEVDAIHPDTLREMCNDVIVQHLDREGLAARKAVEMAERDTLRQFAKSIGGGDE